MASTGIFLTNTVTRLQLLSQGQVLGVATGFFLKHNDSWNLVTNWHVLTGREPATGQPRHASGAVPDTCRYQIVMLTETGLAWFPFDAALGDPGSGDVAWLQHPVLGQDADVAVLPLPGVVPPLAKDLLDPTGHDAEMFLDLGAEVFLPGYPLGFAANGQMPIWKRASLASSLEFGHSIDGFCYVDTATREGMSGAPCLAISNWRHYTMDRTTNTVRIVERPLSWRLVGVYSGRRNPSDGFEAQIGVVWREGLILETLRNGAPGAVRFR